MATTRNLGLALFDNGKENAEQWVKQQNYNGEGTEESPFSNAQIIDNWAGTVRQLPATTSEDAGKFYSVGPDGKPVVQKVEVGNAGGSNLIAKTETEMETFLTLDNVGKIVSYIGDNGKYEANRVYSIVQENDTVIANPIGIKVESITFEGVQLILTLDNGETISAEIPHTTAILSTEEMGGGGGNFIATNNEQVLSFCTRENIGKLISYVGTDEQLYKKNSVFVIAHDSDTNTIYPKNISNTGEPDEGPSFSPEDAGKFLVVDTSGNVVAMAIDKAEGGAY